MIIKNNLAGKILKRLVSDVSAWMLILSNIVVIFLAVKEQWPLSTVIWTYWWQSVIIGLFTVTKILSLRDFSTEGVTLQDKPVAPSKETKRRSALFFSVHYGFFHLCYALILLALLKNVHDIKHIALAALIFFANHLFSFIYNRKEDQQRRQYLGGIMGFPYARIIPMHLFVLTGGFLFPGSFLVIFLILKTLADVIMHVIGHENWYLPKD